MNESIESHLRKYRTISPPELLRNDILSSLPTRRFRHRQQIILRLSIALLVLTIFGAHIMENHTAKQMMAVMYPAFDSQPTESGMLACLTRPGLQLPLSPRTPIASNFLVTVVSIDIIKGDSSCDF